MLKLVLHGFAVTFKNEAAMDGSCGGYRSGGNHSRFQGNGKSTLQEPTRLQSLLNQLHHMSICVTLQNWQESYEKSNVEY